MACLQQAHAHNDTVAYPSRVSQGPSIEVCYYMLSFFFCILVTTWSTVSIVKLWLIDTTYCTSCKHFCRDAKHACLVIKNCDSLTQHTVPLVNILRDAKHACLIEHYVQLSDWTYILRTFYATQNTICPVAIEGPGQSKTTIRTIRLSNWTYILQKLLQMQNTLAWQSKTMTPRWNEHSANTLRDAKCDTPSSDRGPLADFQDRDRRTTIFFSYART